MFNKKNDFEAFENKVWLASPTMHDGAEMKYVKEAYGLCLFIKESIDKLTRNKKPKDEKCKCLMNFVSYEYYILLYNYSLYQGEDKHLYLNELQNYKWVTKYTASMKFKVLMFFLRILGIEITSKIVGIIKNKRK